MVIQRIDGRLTKIPETKAQDLRLQQFQKIKQERATREALKKAGRDFSSQLEPSKFVGTISDYEKALKSIDPRVKPFLTVNLNSIKAEQIKRIEILKRDIEKSRKKETELKKKSRSKSGESRARLRAKAKGEDARQKEAIKLLSRLRNGELLDLKKISNFLNEVENRARKAKEAKFRSQITTKSVVFGKDLSKFVGKGFTNKSLRDKGLSFREIGIIGQAELDTRKLDFQLKQIKAGKSSPGKLLKEGKITAAQATQLVRKFELSESELNKIRNKNVNEIFKRLEKGRGRTIVDSTTQTRAFKVGVNQALKLEFEKPLPFSSTVEQFNTALVNLEKKKKSKKTLRQTLGTGAISVQTQSIENKFLTGQTITPSEQQIFLENIAKSNKDLTKQQVALAKKILLSPINYGKNLVIRAQKGEKSPLIKDLSNFGIGIGKGLKDLFVDPLIGSFNYGRSLVSRAEKGNTRAIKILIRDVKKLSNGIKNTVLFVKKNPITTGIIVSAAIGTGLKLTKFEFKKNPVESLGRAIAWFFPGKIIKAGGKGISAIGKGVKSSIQLTRLTQLNKLLKPIVKGGGLTPKQLKSLSAIVKRSSTGSTKIQREANIKLFLMRVLKARGIKGRKGASLNTLIKQVRASRKIVKATQIIKVPTKRPVLKFKGKKVTKISVKTATKLKPKPRKKRDPSIFFDVKGNSIEKITKKDFQTKVKVSITRDKPIAIDVRRASEKALRQRLARQGIIKQDGLTFVDLNAVNRITKPKSPVRGFFANKKGSLRLQTKIKTQVQVFDTKVKQIKRTKRVTIKQLTILDRSIKNLMILINNARLINIVGRLTLLRKLAALRKDIAILKLGATKGKLIPATKALTKAQSKALTKAKSKALTKARAITKAKLIQKKTLIKKPKIKKVKGTRITRKLKPSLTLKLSTKLPQGSRLAFNFRFRRKGKVLTKKLQLPLNKALKMAVLFIKRTPARSLDLVIAGITKLQDVKKPSLTDFRLRVLNSKALILVEKPKSAIKGLRRR